MISFPEIPPPYIPPCFSFAPVISPFFAPLPPLRVYMSTVPGRPRDECPIPPLPTTISALPSFLSPQWNRFSFDRKTFVSPPFPDRHFNHYFRSLPQPCPPPLPLSAAQWSSLLPRSTNLLAQSKKTVPPPFSTNCELNPLAIESLAGHLADHFLFLLFSRHRRLQHRSFFRVLITPPL